MGGEATQIHRRRPSRVEGIGIWWEGLFSVALRLGERCQTELNILVYLHYISFMLK